MACVHHTFKPQTHRAAILVLLFLAIATASWAAPKTCGANGPETLTPFGNIHDDYMTDLKVVGQCDVNAPSGQQGPLVYAFRSVNITNGGKLIFHDEYDIDFYAENILVEFGGTLTAVTTQPGFLPEVTQASGVLPFSKKLTFHLWGASGDPGAVCASDPQPQGAPCGIPDALWEANTAMSMSLNTGKNPPPPPAKPKNQACNHITGYSKYLPGDDCFYQYEIQDAADQQAKRQAFFGHKVLAVSFGGSLQLFGSRGVSYLKAGQKCTPGVPNTECNPAFTGTSWVRLTGVTDATHITVSRAVDWNAGDVVAVTATDYLPSHTEEVTIESNVGNTTKITLRSPGLKNNHFASMYSLAAITAKDVGPEDDPNTPDVKKAIDTRAAVALLTRNIRVVSEGDVPSDPFTEKPGNYFGGHTIVRQGFASYQVQGVEFYQLGQGGAKGRYPVHFHMARKTAQPTPTDDDPTPEPLNYLKDCSIHDSMTRWVTLHATEGMYLARNVGEKSIGHGYYFEDATEIGNRLYANIGILARAAIMDTTHNPRQVPGILASNQPNRPPFNNLDYMPFRSDYNHPSVFWITNGWNDFEYNFAAGAATCGACYWWLPTAVSGPSQYQRWDGYASEQIVTDAPTNYGRSGLAPLKTFVGNACVAAMSAFQMNGQTGECLGVLPTGPGGLSAVPSKAPPGPDGTNLPNQPFGIYYPVAGEVHTPTLCVPVEGQTDCTQNAAGQGASPCDAADTFGTCEVTHLDHFTSSFNFAQTNFAAVWLRKGWDLVTNSAFTDVQTGGLNFVTGGGYTRSDVSVGEWLVARNSVFVGHTQPLTGNKFALDVGPFNADSGLKCDNTSGQAADHCEYADGGVSFNLPTFPGQKLINIYDGPSHQLNNAYMDINVSTISDCKSTNGGSCNTSVVPLAWNNGVLQGPPKSAPTCYLPNAAIAWKQPNGFYYPPAFHSRNLWFNNVDIRHFVVEPLFKSIDPAKCDPPTKNDCDPFQQDQSATTARYCTYASDMFSASFNHIDRQTVLNDDDGTLTGLVGSYGGEKRPTISINEDDFFNTPLTTPECLSDVNVKPPLPLPANMPFTARTSPYEWLSTAMIADCAIAQQTGALQCYEPSDQLLHWAQPCGNSSCRGVPLYREYLTDQEPSTARPQIRMMGQGNGQRSTLSLNHGAYYIDTTQNCTSQGGCPKCKTPDPDHPNQCKTYEPSSWNPSIFLAGHTYYVYFIYATATTRQKYDLFVGKNTSIDELKVTPIWLDPSSYSITPNPGGSFIGANYQSSNGILTVNVDLTSQGDAFTEAKPKFCRPQSYCSVKNDGSCGCNPDNKDCSDTYNDCSWGPNDIDCPVDPNNPNVTRCFGFSFTMPPGFKAPPAPMQPPAELFVPFTDNPYFQKSVVTFDQGLTISPSDECYYKTVPTQQ